MIDKSGGVPAPAGFRENNAGILVPEALSRDQETWTDEEAKIVERATRIVNARGWFLTFTCPHERCRAQPVVEGHQVAGGQVLQCQHKTVTVLKPIAGKPNAAMARRRQARQAQLEERAIVPIAKRMLETKDAGE